MIANLITRLVVLSIHTYRRVVSPFLPPRCRFDPTCSRYAIHAIEHHGLRRGGWMALKRIFRCHPFNPEWGYDPVPVKSASVKQAKKRIPAMNQIVHLSTPHKY